MIKKFKNATPLKKYLIYNRISGSYNLLNWILTIVLAILTNVFFDEFSDGEFINQLISIIIASFWVIAVISSFLFIIKSFSIQKEYDKEKKIVLFSFLSLIIPFIFNFLIRRKLKPYSK